MDNKIAFFSEKPTGYLIKAIKQIEQADVFSSEEQSLINRIWSLILVKSDQFVV